MMENQDENALPVNGEEGGAGDADDHVSCLDSSRKSEELYQKDQLYLRSLLPEDEVWRDILFLLKDPNDLANCVNASPYFWELERENRVIFLFPKVMQVLTYHYAPRKFEVKGDKKEENQGAPMEMNTDTSAENEEIYEEVIDDIGEEDDVEDAEDTDDDDDGEDAEDIDNEVDREDAEYVYDEERYQNVQRKRKVLAEWRRTVLNCRLVCSTWNQALENIYQSPVMTGIREYVKDLDPRSFENTMYIENVDWNVVDIWDLESAQKFLENFELSHHSGATAPPKNPLFGRYLSYTIDKQAWHLETYPEFQATLTKILTLFGSHVWYCSLDAGVNPTNIEESYVRLRECLTLMPNLKFVEITGCCKNAPMPATLMPNLKIDRKGCSKPVPMPAEIFQRNPLPNLEKLDNVHFSMTGGPIVTEFLRRNGGHLSFVNFSNIKGVDVDSVGDLLANLRGFSSEHSAYGDAMLEKFVSGWKQLTMLDLWKSQDFKTTIDFLQSANFQSETLTDLHLQLGNDHHTLLEDSKALRLDLPNLRRLYLCIRSPFSLDFALPLAKSLEHLEITFFSVREVQQETIQFAGFEKKMEESNIWSLFGNLKTIKMGTGYYDGGGFTVYTRQGDKIEYG